MESENSLTIALLQFETAETNLSKSERLLKEISALSPKGTGFGEDLDYDKKCRSFENLLLHLPLINDWRPSSIPMDLETIGQFYRDAIVSGNIEEFSMIDWTEGVVDELRKYRFLFNQKRRELIRNTLLTLIKDVDSHIHNMQLSVEKDSTILQKDWACLTEYIKKINDLLGNDEKPNRWQLLQRHLAWAKMKDFDDITSMDWPEIKKDLSKYMYNDDEPIPSEIKDLSVLVSIQREDAPVIFVSYSHDDQEHKDWVLNLATRLRENGVNVILDRWNLTLGGNLPAFIEKGLTSSQRILCICSENYVRKANDGKGGVGFEKMIMTADLMEDLGSDKIIPVIRKNQLSKKMPTFLGGKVYANFNLDEDYESAYEQLLRDIHHEPILPIPHIGKNPFIEIRQRGNKKFSPSNEKYSSPATKGLVSFDFSNNNSQYSIGQGKLLFETKWSGASNESIYALKDAESIKSLSLVTDKKKINEIDDVSMYDDSSRVRQPNIGEIIIWQNSNGYYAATKILEVNMRSRGYPADKLAFEYFILTNGSDDFTT